MSYDLKIDNIYGLCPVQGEGTIDGREFYFRARHQRWAFAVAGDTGDAVDAHLRDIPGAYYTEGDWGESAYEAGYMPESVARGIIEECARQYAKWRETAPARPAEQETP